MDKKLKSDMETGVLEKICKDCTLFELLIQGRIGVLCGLWKV